MSPDDRGNDRCGGRDGGGRDDDRDGRGGGRGGSFGGGGSSYSGGGGRDRGGGGSSFGGRGGGSSFSGEADDGMQTQPDTLFVQGLPHQISEQDLVEHFGSIGTIKVLHTLLVLIAYLVDFHFWKPILQIITCNFVPA
jgi:hypothetical protein